jgi:putative FmdB family regulatory protein
MPIYEYQCQQCNHELERLQKMSDEQLRDCPACEAPELRRLVSAAGFRLKGAGWYETDFKQGQKRNLADSGNDKVAGSDGAGNGAAKPAKAEPASGTTAAVESTTGKQGKGDPA